MATLLDDVRVVESLQMDWAACMVQRVISQPRCDAKMAEIADAIQTGAVAFLRQKYTWWSPVP